MALCVEEGRLPLPWVIIVFSSLKWLFRVADSSANFFIYFLAGNEFRTRLRELFEGCFRR